MEDVTIKQLTNTIEDFRKDFYAEENKVLINLTKQKENLSPAYILAIIEPIISKQTDWHLFSQGNMI